MDQDAAAVVIEMNDDSNSSSSSEEDELILEAPLPDMVQVAPALSVTPPINMAQQAPPISMTQQAPPISMTQQAPPISMTQQAPPISMTQQAPPISMTQQTTPISMTQQAPPISMTQQQAPPISRTTPFNMAQWVSPSRVAQPHLPNLAQPHLPNLAQAALQRLAVKGGGGVERLDDSSADFKSPKKRKLQEEKDGDCDNEGQTCSICFEPWTNSGGHRIASLRCGHLFGYTCIEKWLKKAQPSGKCPQCNFKARRKDIRVIYAKLVSAVDTTERDRALTELEAEKTLRISVQKAEAQAVLQYQLAKAECERLKARLWKQADRASLNVSQTGGSRVLAHNPLTGMLVASKPSNNQLVPGYGVLKLSTLDLHCSEYVPIHGAALRDMSFSPHDAGMLLSVGMDKTAKLTSMHSNTTVLSYKTPGPAWACAWNQDSDHYFYCGLQNGTIQMFDKRNTTGSVVDLHCPGGASYPVTSLAYVPLCRASTLSCGGLLMGTLGGCVFWEKGQAEDRFTPHAVHGLPEGACTSLSFDVVTRHCLASHRPSKSSPHSRHTLFQLLGTGGDGVPCQPLHQFIGGSSHKLLSHSRLFQRPGSEDRLMVAFGDEATNTTHIWDATTQSHLQHLPADNQPTLDVLSYASSGADHLAILTESKVFVHQWQWS
ncbi:hypothetical protein EMCRGX_G033025 [Ephydatia muelleri]